MTVCVCLNNYLPIYSIKVQEHPSDVLWWHRQRTRTSLQTQQRRSCWTRVPNKVRASRVIVLLNTASKMSFSSSHPVAFQAFTLADSCADVATLLTLNSTPRYSEMKMKAKVKAGVLFFLLALVWHACLHLTAINLDKNRSGCLTPLSVHYKQFMVPLSVMSSPSCCIKLKCCIVFSRIARFTNVQHLSIHISKNFGAESTRVYYIGLRGEYSEVSHSCLKPKLLDLRWYVFFPDHSQYIVWNKPTNRLILLTSVLLWNVCSTCRDLIPFSTLKGWYTWNHQYVYMCRDVELQSWLD